MHFPHFNKTVVAIAVLAFGWMSFSSQSPGAPNAGDVASGDKLQVFTSMLPTGGQQVVVIDSLSRSMAVYHIEPAQGKLGLKSVRNLTWDLSMEQFNGQAPLPSELRQAR